MIKLLANIAFGVALFAASVAIAAYSVGHTQRRYDIRDAVLRTGGNPDSGKQKIMEYGCATCHTIPGIAGPQGEVGPPLTKFAMRTYVAGIVPNTPDNLRHWIQKPHEIEPRTAMPEMGVTDEDARQISAYLYTLH